MAVQMGAHDLVENARVDDHADHREHASRDRGECGPGRAGDMAIDDENRGCGVGDGDDPEHDECRSRDAQNRSRYVRSAAPTTILGRGRGRASESAPPLVTSYELGGVAREDGRGGDRGSRRRR